MIKQMNLAQVNTWIEMAARANGHTRQVQL